MVDLERRVVDLEAVVDEARELEAPCVTVLLASHDHMRSEGGEAGGHFPRVHVVDLDHPGMARHRRADPLGVEPLR